MYQKLCSYFGLIGVVGVNIERILADFTTEFQWLIQV